MLGLIVVLMLIAMVMNYAVPSYQSVQYKIQRSDAQNVLLSLIHAQRLFYSQHHTFTAELDEVLAYAVIYQSTDAYQFTAQACEGEAIQLCVELSAIPNDGEQLTMAYNSRNQKKNW